MTKRVSEKTIEAEWNQWLWDFSELWTDNVNQKSQGGDGGYPAFPAVDFLRHILKEQRTLWKSWVYDDKGDPRAHWQPQEQTKMKREMRRQGKGRGREASEWGVEVPNANHASPSGVTPSPLQNGVPWCMAGGACDPCDLDWKAYLQWLGKAQLNLISSPGCPPEGWQEVGILRAFS